MDDSVKHNVVTIGDDFRSFASQIARIFAQHGWVVADQINVIVEKKPEPDFTKFRELLIDRFGEPKVAFEKEIINQKKARGGKSFHEIQKLNRGKKFYVNSSTTYQRNSGIKVTRRKTRRSYKCPHQIRK